MSAPVVIPYIGLARPSVLNATAAARISTFLILFFMLFANNSALSHNVGTHSFSSGPKVTRVADDATREFRTARWYPPVESHSEITVSHHTVKVTTTHLHAHTLLPSHPHPPSGRLRTVQILCHPLLTAPFAGNLDVPSWLPRWERSLPLPSLFPGALNHQVLQALPVLLSAQHPSRATLACHLVASLGVLVAFLPARWYM